VKPSASDVNVPALGKLALNQTGGPIIGQDVDCWQGTNMNANKKCEICQKPFVPDKRHPRQTVCYEKECRRKARIAALRKWRNRYPDYFKGRTDNKEDMRAWRKANPTYYRDYRKAHPELKQKTREYMRAYRTRKAKSFQAQLLAKTKSSSVVVPDQI